MLPKVELQRLLNTVVDPLRNFIVEGLLASGVKPDERTLCETRAISGTPLREAVRGLAAEGLIDILPNRGTSVWQMSAAEIRETFKWMSGLEAFAGELACERITPVELSEIKALHYAMLAGRVVRHNYGVRRQRDNYDGRRVAVIQPRAKRSVGVLQPQPDHSRQDQRCRAEFGLAVNVYGGQSAGTGVAVSVQFSDGEMG